ncbi:MULTISPECIES: TIGR02117 family protein [Empedobacter]|uniref:TIGR02117 family protein n=1 Tax=Empedobacter falsenii TaxID=343874 RepID=A0A427BNN6_9FLAO|nr:MULTISPECIES: TIGR02117 family protein [Empedobacter]MBW1618174.1 TIGR02117 family protein [Empedobacter falsenii]MDH0675424.1 TIGR02117 family protein [Empedobacter sp. GD03861]RRT91320.1 TIGR02117 family protein [Empedobacter falsenii]RRT91379.1 TIGR02117 family protein [Empedobacter falsenii]
MKKVFRILLKTLGLLVLLIVVYLLAVVLLPMIPVNKEKQKLNDQITAYILTNGVHTDIVVPVKSEAIDWSTFVLFSDTKSKKEYKYIAFGWGDKGFYLDTPEWKDLKFSTAFNAAFWLGDSAMHTTFYDNMTESEDCKRVDLSVEEYQKLIVYIKQSFNLDQNNKVELIKTDAVYGDSDSFYEAKRSYSLFFTCNTWAANALKEANKEAPLWTATQQGIFRHYE